MSYYIQYGCGKKLTKKPMKTLICPRCGSVYKKPKKFILAVYIYLLLFFMLAFAFIPDKMGILASAGSGIGAYIMFLWIVDTLELRSFRRRDTGGGIFDFRRIIWGMGRTANRGAHSYFILRGRGDDFRKIFSLREAKNQ